MRNMFTGVAFALFAAAVLPAAAFAHATPVTYEPEASALLEKAPESVRIRFSERVEQGASTIRVFAPDGSRADAGNPAVDLEDAHVFSVGLGGTATGTYAVSWQVVSADDGHFTKGAYVFSAGKPNYAPQGVQAASVEVLHSSSWPEAATIWLELLGHSVLLGALLLYGLLWRKWRMSGIPEVAGAEAAFTNRFRWFVVIGGFFVLVGTFAYLALRSFELAQANSTPFFENFKTFAATVSGSFTLYRAALTVLFLLVFFAGRNAISKSQSFTKNELALYVLLGVMAFIRARVSHAAASAFAPAFSISVNAVHLVFKELWIGGVAAFTVLYLPLMKHMANIQFSKRALAVFSKLAILALAAGGVSGCYIAWLHLKDFSNLTGSEWGNRFLWLLAFAAVLLAVRLYHQLFAERELSRTPPDDAEGSWRMLNKFQISFSLEVLVAVVVLFASSLLVITTPPLSPRERFEKTAVSQGVHIVLNENPSVEGEFIAFVHDKVPAKKVTVILFNEEKSIGPIVVTPEKNSKGEYAFAKNLLTPPGNWKVEIVAEREGAYDANAAFTVNYPSELQSREIVEHRAFGRFEWFFALAALGVALLSAWLYRRERRLEPAF